jgi:xanthine dehydrogenase accessory factor
MDFYIHLYEERAGLNTMEQNNFVHEKMVVADYSELKQLIPSGKNSYVVIMTFGYRTDYIAVKALIGKHFTYTGLLGSSNKIQKMFENLQEESIDKKILDDIYAPIGLQIRSQTPEEIAISIAAEIIGVKNSLLP